MSTAEYSRRKYRRRALSGSYAASREETDFSRWIERKGLPVASVANLVGVTPKTIYYWAAGYRVPDLVAAARIEHLTDGEVPALSFLTTKLARRIANEMLEHSAKVTP